MIKYGALILLIQFCLISNIWSKLADNGWIMPEESNVLKFCPIEQNKGNGDWWTYGEDKDNYYSTACAKDIGEYWVVSKASFTGEPLDCTTWENAQERP